MSNNEGIRSFEYKNDFFYIVIRQAPEMGPKAYAYCCGINIARFDPLCWGKHGICSNPAFKGLQLLRADVSDFARRKNIAVKNAGQFPCSPITPRGDGWYRETTLLIEQATPKQVQAILDFSVTDLVRVVLAVCAPEAMLPARLPNPPALQKYLESMSVKNYKEVVRQKAARQQ